MEGYPPGLAAFGRHDEYIKIAIAVAGEGDAFAVMAPYRHKIMRRVRCELRGRSAAARDAIQIALGGKDDGLAIGRYRGIAQPAGIVGGCIEYGRNEEPKSTRDSFFHKRFTANGVMVIMIVRATARPRGF